MSKHPIVGMETHMFRLTGTPIFVQQGDWIAGKGCGCVTIAHPQLGEVDVWDTHFTALGGQMGPEIQRTERTFEAVGGLRDSYFDVYDDESASGITCDSPMNTWSHTKKLDELALRQSGKRIDFILYRGPAADTGRLRCVSHQVGFKELVPNLNVSYSDHFSVEAVFRIAAVQETRAAAHEETRADVIECAIGVLQEALGRSDRMQSRHLRWFYLMLGGAGLLVAGNVCASVWLHGASSVGPSLVTSVLLIAGSWAGTTALYSGVVWGEWYKPIDEMETGT
ncbi:sphingomyelin phosphodiesterase [Malassezia caprae]|uniref:Sphingomyelin phosphodiesterase n=1 Tax=Malassezia caprae TaxID=1381934 RepID=A0AAF0IWT1_9BASI|nr:sphingomyelin phosphodiesterase [Malassezia caprae]